MTRRLVITADDLGREPGTTDVITSLLAEGHVTATTLITVSPVAEPAAEQMRRIGVVPHLHVTLTSERGLVRWRPKSSALSLVDADGALPDDPFALAARGRTDDVVAEMQAQLAWMHEQGLHPLAADSHAGTLYGLHGGPGPGPDSWLARALHWCATHGLAFRLPRDPTPYWGGPLPAELAPAHEQAVALADSLGVAIPQTIATNRRGAGELGSYERLRDQYVEQLAVLPEGTSELFLHPSSADAVDVVRTWEAQLLADPKWHKAIENEDIELVNRWWE